MTRLTSLKYIQIVFIIVGLSVLIPATVDRLVISTLFTKSDEGVKDYAIVTFIDILMLFSMIIKSKMDQSTFIFTGSNPIKYRQLIILIFVVISAIAAAFASQYYHFPAAIRGVFYFIRYVGIFFWVRYMISDISNLYYLYNTIFTAFLGIILLVLLSPKENYEGGNRLSVATFGVNTFGHLLNFFCLLCLPFIILFKKNKNYLFLGGIIFCLILMLGFLFLSGNRSSTLLFAISSVIFFLLRPGKMYKKFQLLVGSLFFTIIFYGILLAIKPDIASRILETFKLVGGNTSLDDIKELQARFFVWEVCINMILSNPILGIGPAQWNFLKNVYGDFPYWITGILDPHNGYLLLASEVGLPVALLYYSTMITSIKSGFKSIKMLKNKLKQCASNPIYVFLIDSLIILTIIIIDWLLSDLTNASFLNLRIQSILWVFSSILLLSPSLITKKTSK